MTELNENNLPDPEQGGSGGPEGNQGGAGGNEWTGPSREEWSALQEQNKRLAESLDGLTSAFAEPQYEPQNTGGDFDLSQIDMTDPYQAAWLMDQIAQSRIGAMAPYVKNAAQDQGQRQMQSLLSNHEKELSNDFPAGFDKKLAERAAFAFFDETGDPEGSVLMGARYAAEVRKQEREAAISEYRTKNNRGGVFSDLGASESGVRAAPTLKTYDEVLEKYASQNEV